MNVYTYNITSKNIDSLQKSIKFIRYNSVRNGEIVEKHSNKRKLKSFLTVLKSPHVNKSAQEQFESRVFTRQLTIYSHKKFKYLYFLRKTFTNLFPLVKCEIKFHKNPYSKLLINQKIMDPTNAYFNNLHKHLRTQKNYRFFTVNNKFNLTTFKSTKYFIQLYCSYGKLINKSQMFG